MSDINRVAEQPAYLLHRRNFRESSLLIEAFTPNYGRMGLIAKGAKRSGASGNRLQPFRPLLISWSGRGELRTVTGVDEQGRIITPYGNALAAGFYLNELLLRLLPREDPHPELFSSYREALLELEGSRLEEALRLFERELLSALGFGLELELEVLLQEPLQPTQRYRYQRELGPVAVLDGDEGVGEPTLLGSSLIALGRGELSDPISRRECKRLLRWSIDQLLDGRPLRSRELLRRRPPDATSPDPKS